MILLPLVFTLLVYSTFAKQSQIKDAQQTTLQSLEQVDSSLRLSLENATYQRNLFTGAPRLMTSLKKILAKNTMSYTDVVIVDCIQILIGQSLNYNLNIHSVYLGLDDYKRFFSSDKGIQSIDNFVDDQWYSLYLSRDTDDKIWTCRRSYLEYNRRIELISVFMQLINARGVIVVNLNPERLQSMIDKTYFNANEAIFLLDSNHDILLNNSKGGEYKNDFSEHPDSTVDLSEIPFMEPTRVTIKDTSYYATLTAPSEYGFQLLSLIKERDYYPLTLYINTTIALQASAAVIMALLLAVFVTLKNTRQFYHLFDVLNDAENGVFHKHEGRRYMVDEYDLIINNVIKTFISNKSLKNELTEKQHLKTKAELTALQLQINPHFLFNFLQLLDNQAYSLTNGYTELNGTIQNLSAILKYTLASPQESVKLKEELDHLHFYADINYKRYPNMFILYFDYDEDILDYYTFRLILQPLIENSLYHGIRPLNRIRMGLIKIRIYRKDAFLHFLIIDNGRGMDKEKLKQLRLLLESNEISSRHIGLSNTNSRLVMYFGRQCGIRIHSKVNVGTSVRFCIPLIQEKEDFLLA